LKINDSNTVIDSFEDHKHNKPDEKTLNRQKISNSLKRKAVEDISSKPSKLLHSELQRENVNTLTLSDTALIKRNIRNIRSTVHPNLPKTVIETHEVINKIIIKTNTDEPFLMVNDHDNNIIGFSTTSNLIVLCDINTIYVDGTFKSCPKHFLQIFTIHALVSEMYVPLVFFYCQIRKPNLIFILLSIRWISVQLLVKHFHQNIFLLTLKNLYIMPRNKFGQQLILKVVVFTLDKIGEKNTMP